MRAFRVSTFCMDIIVAAESAGQARYRVYKITQQSEWPAWLLGLGAKRAPEFDAWAADGKPGIYDPDCIDREITIEQINKAGSEFDFEGYQDSIWRDK